MEFTQPVSWIGKPLTGYVMNAEFSNDNARILAKLIQEIEATFDGAVFCMPKSSLHITLLDWIAPLVDYGGQDKDKLFKKTQPSYDKAMSEILSRFSPIRVHFDTIKTSPSTVFIVGRDNGEFQKIRNEFMKRVKLQPGTKMPPQIIHSSLARFTKPIETKVVNSFLATKRLDFTQEISGFRLLRTTKEPTLEYETLKRYKLESP